MNRSISRRQNRLAVLRAFALEDGSSNTTADVPIEHHQRSVDRSRNILSRSLNETVTANETYDVILIPPLVIVVGPEGLHQYDYTDVATTGELVLLSHLDVVNPPATAPNMR